MSWDAGVQADIRPSLNAREVNAEIAALEGTLDEDEAMYYLGKFLSANVTFTAELMLGVELFPFQHILVKTMSEMDYTLAVLGRGMSKSWSAGMFAGIYAAMHQNSSEGAKIGIISSTFRQSKQIFGYLEAASEKPSGALFKAVSKVSRGSDQWVMNVGNSSIVALPLGMGGEKLRGFRFNCLLIDEFLLMPENTFNEVIMPFLSTVPNPQERAKIKRMEDEMIASGKMDPKDRIRWPNNKLVALSSASYKFEYLYQMYSNYENLILGYKPENQEILGEQENENLNPPTRAIIHMSHDMAPPTLYDQANVDQAKSTFSKAQFEREYEAKFTDDSSGFYKMSTLKERTIPHGESPCTEIVGDPESEYILAIDPNASESADSDDFSMCVLKLDTERETATMVHGYNVHGGKLKDHQAYCHYLLTHFNIVAFVLDKAGGVTFWNSCLESSLFQDEKLRLSPIEKADFNDNKKYNDDIASYTKEYNLKSGRIVFYRYFSSSWIREANERLSAALDHKKLWFASAGNAAAQKGADFKVDPAKLQFAHNGAEDDPNKKMKGANRSGSAKIDLIENQFAMIELTKTECAMIEVSTSKQGVQSFDLPANLKKQKGANRARRDAYTSLLMANWMARVYFDHKAGRGEKQFESFVPFVI